MTPTPPKLPACPPRCPICGKPRAQAWRPFCSKRCADIDLGRWFGGAYAIPGEPAPDGEGREG
ncbi:MAG: DNA gyrase inhibitor YacG [Pikeienuella sp.]